jgi:hypothetical protein
MTVASSYDLPNYVGELFQKQDRPNAALQALGGVGSFRTVGAAEFAMGVYYTLPSASQPTVLEGATPTASQTDTTQTKNVVQIFHEAVELTYSRLAVTDAISGLAVIPGKGNGELQRPGTLEWQIMVKLQKIARDINYSVIRGAYQLPTDNTTARKMRGIRTGVTTNLAANGGTPRAIDKTIVNDALQAWMDAGMFQRGDTLRCFGDATQIGKLIALYEADTQQPITRTEAGVQLRTIVTRWATLEVTVEPDMASGELFIWRPEKCQLVALPVPQKGVLFAEPLSKAGSSEKYQLYGEIGVDYTNEIFHGVIDDLS